MFPPNHLPPNPVQQYYQGSDNPQSTAQQNSQGSFPQPMVGGHYPPGTLSHFQQSPGPMTAASGPFRHSWPHPGSPISQSTAQQNSQGSFPQPIVGGHYPPGTPSHFQQSPGPMNATSGPFRRSWPHPGSPISQSTTQQYSQGSLPHPISGGHYTPGFLAPYPVQPRVPDSFQPSVSQQRSTQGPGHSQRSQGFPAPPQQIQQQGIPHQQVEQDTRTWELESTYYVNEQVIYAPPSERVAAVYRCNRRHIAGEHNAPNKSGAWDFIRATKIAPLSNIQLHARHSIPPPKDGKIERVTQIWTTGITYKTGSHAGIGFSDGTSVVYAAKVKHLSRADNGPRSPHRGTYWQKLQAHGPGAGSV